MPITIFNKLKNLHRLNIRGCNYGCEILDKLPNLQELDTFWTSIPTIGKLRKLNIACCEYQGFFMDLRDLIVPLQSENTMLVDLKICECSLEITRNGTLPNLQNLTMINCKREMYFLNH